MPMFKQGVAFYYSKSFREVSDQFSRVLEIHPYDKAARLLLSRSKQYHDGGIPDNWTGVEEMQFK